MNACSRAGRRRGRLKMGKPGPPAGAIGPVGRDRPRWNRGRFGFLDRRGVFGDPDALAALRRGRRIDREIATVRVDPFGGSGGPSAVIWPATSAGVRGFGPALMLMHAGRRNTIAAGSKSNRRWTAIRDPRDSHLDRAGADTADASCGGAARSRFKQCWASIGKLGNWRSQSAMEKGRACTPGLLQSAVQVSRNCGRGHVTWGEVHPLAALIEVDRPVGQCEQAVVLGPPDVTAGA